MNEEALVSVENLKKYFPAERKIFIKSTSKIMAVDDVSFYIRKGETFGLVGESGCGKTTIGRTLIKLYNPTAGKMTYSGTDITHMNERDFKVFRRRMQMVFQDPYSSLNPRMYVMDIIGEGLETHGIAKGKEKEERVYEILDNVGLKRDHAHRFAYEFSGGQRQRIGIARALVLRPEFVVCDEPIASLDVSIQAQVVNLLKQFQNELRLTYLFIAHDLSMVKYISDRVGVMYTGRMMEYASSAELYAHPLHPYTQALLSAIPRLDAYKKGQSKREILQGDVVSPINTPQECLFAKRCKYCMKICRESVPKLKEVAPGHFVACHLMK